MKPWTRLLAGLGLILLLGGPTPGSVGSCADEDQAADPVQFCIDKKYWICERQGPSARGELTAEQLEQCKAPILAECQGTTWPSDCVPPTELETKACIDALRDFARLSMHHDALPECQDLCRRGI